MVTASSTLSQGLATLALPLSEDQQSQLLVYIALLAHWNKTYNLTAIQTPETMVPYHLLDSLSLLPYLSGTRHLDIGTGAGLPGIPLAIACPMHHFTLLDSNGKKIRFLQHVCQRLSLKNVDLVHDRIECFFPNHPLDTLLTRAFSSLPKLLSCTQHLMTPTTTVLAMKGHSPTEELQTLKSAGFSVTVHALSVPFVTGQRTIICYRFIPTPG